MSNQTEVMMLRKLVRDRLDERMVGASIDFAPGPIQPTRLELDKDEMCSVLTDQLADIAWGLRSCRNEEERLRLLLSVIEFVDRMWSIGPGRKL